MSRWQLSLLQLAGRHPFDSSAHFRTKPTGRCPSESLKRSWLALQLLWWRLSGDLRVYTNTCECWRTGIEGHELSRFCVPLASQMPSTELAWHAGLQLKVVQATTHILQSVSNCRPRLAQRTASCHIHRRRPEQPRRRCGKRSSSGSTSAWLRLYFDANTPRWLPDWWSVLRWTTG